jgi:hypothetical protein
MTRAGTIPLALVALGVAAAARPPVGLASELCRVRSKALVVRDVCKPREETLTPDAKRELGMGGEPGPRGSHGPGTGDLRVLDADGHEVGVVTGTADYYGYGSATAVGRVTLPGGSGPEFVVADVDGNGISSVLRCEDVAQVYRTSDCLGPALVQCFGSECAPGGARFARPILRQDATTACHEGDPSEVETGNFFRRIRMIASTLPQLIGICQETGGTLVGTPTPCRRGSAFCGQCCRPANGIAAIPLHYFDAALVGTPPFRLAR